MPPDLMRTFAHEQDGNSGKKLAKGFDVTQSKIVARALDIVRSSPGEGPKSVCCFDGDVCIIHTPSGHQVQIDAADFPLVRPFSWVHRPRPSGKPGYAQTTVNVDGGRKTLSLHTLLMSPADGYVVDHINGDGLDNRRANLRIATHRQNVMNVGLRTDNTSGFKGVTYRRVNRKWQARIVEDGKRISLGLFNTAAEAGAAYRAAAIRIYGEFGVFPGYRPQDWPKEE